MGDLYWRKNIENIKTDYLNNNNNAVVTGEYEKIYKNMLTEEELKLYKEL